MVEDIFESYEELHFSWYLKELQKQGYIISWERNDKSYQMTEGLYRDYIIPMKRVDDKKKTQTIIKPSVYTPDFNIFWHEKSEGIFVTDLSNKTLKSKISTPFISNFGLTVVETKGSFDQNNMTRLANNNVKFVWKLYQVYVQIVKIPNIFNTTFTPNRYLFTDKTKVLRKIKYKNIITIKDFTKK